MKFKQKKCESNVVYTNVEFVGVVTFKKKNKPDKMHIRVNAKFNEKETGDMDYYIDLGDSVMVSQPIELSIDATALAFRFKEFLEGESKSEVLQ